MWVSGFVTQLLLELGNSWMQEASFKIRPRYSNAMRPRYLLNSGLCGQRSRSVLFEEDRNLCPLPAISQ